MEYSTGPFGVNIATDLMLESVLTTDGNRIDPNREIPNKVNLKKYKKWYINFNSFITNVVSAYDKDTVTSIISKKNKSILDQVKDRVIDEMVILDNLFVDTIEIVYYYVNYNKYKNLLSPIDVKTRSGGMQSVVLEQLMNMVTEDVMFIDNIYIEMYTNKARFESNSLVTTSIPMDLIHSKSIDLLEFHTGVLKKRNMFYTKMKTNNPLPYEEILLLSLGDKKGIIKSPLSIKEKKILMDSIMNKKIKPHMVYSKSGIISMVSDNEISKKMKSIPTIY